MKEVRFYQIETVDELITLYTFHELQDVVGALKYRGKEYRAYEVFTDNTRGIVGL